MLTYKEEDVASPTEETKVSLEEPRPPPSDEVTISTVEVADPPPPPSNVDMDDLLVSSLILDNLMYLMFFGTATPLSAFCFSIYSSVIMVNVSRV